LSNLLNDYWKSEINRPLPQAVLTQSLTALVEPNTLIELNGPG